MKIAIVNDSKAAAEVLRRILAELASFELIWTAYSGKRRCAWSHARSRTLS